MTTLTSAAVRARIEALWVAGFSTTVLTGAEDKDDLAIARIPAVEVHAGEATRAVLATSYTVTRTFECLYLHSRLAANPTNETIQDGKDALELAIEPMAAWFMARFWLELTVGAAKYVMGTEPIRDDGPQSLNWKGSEFIGTVFYIPVKLLSS